MLEQQVSEYQQAVLQDLQKGQNTIYNNMLADPAIAKITEQDFVKYFLPCFAGFFNPPNWIANWIQISGAPTTEVSVVDFSGQELFKVPPLLASSAALLVNRAGSIGDIFKENQLLQGNLAGNAEEVLIHRLNAKSNEIQPSGVESVKARWLQIFSRYNIQQNQNQVNNKLTRDDDFLEYE